MRSKSLTERDVSNEEEDDDNEEVNLQDKYLSVGPRDASRFQGLRHKIVQLKDSTLKKRRSTDNLTSWWQFHEGTGVRRSDSVKEVVRDEPEKGGFIVANPQQGGRVKSALISATNTSGYQSKADYAIYGRTQGRPRPQPIYEKHEDYSKPPASISHYGTVSPRAHIAQATVINLVKTTTRDSEPPPLPPRPSVIKEEESQAPPPMKPKPRSKIISQTTKSLPRRRTDFREKGRRRGRCYEEKKEEEEESSQPYESDDKVV